MGAKFYSFPSLNGGVDYRRTHDGNDVRWQLGDRAGKTPAQWDVVFVCGVYKSGTSLAAAMLGQASYSDPSRVSNPVERGFGTDGNRYLTRECRGLRLMNEWSLLAMSQYDQILSGTSLMHEYSRNVFQEQIGNFSRFLGCYSAPVFFKDPRFVYTLPLWLQSAWQLGKRPAVLFTVRSPVDLQIAWNTAPFTRTLVRSGGLDQMLRFQQIQMDVCRLLRVPHQIYSFEELRRFGETGLPKR